MYQYRLEETAVRRAAAPRVRTAPRACPRVESERAGAQRKAAGLSVPSAAAGGVSRHLLGICCASRHTPPSKGAGAQQRPVIWQHDR